MPKLKALYTCQQCGHQVPKWLGRCPSCSEWNSLVEELVERKAAGTRSTAPRVAPSLLAEVSLDDEMRMPTGLAELDPAKRKVIYDEVQEIIATEVPMTPLVWRVNITPVTSRLKNFKPNPTAVPHTWNVHEWVLN